MPKVTQPMVEESIAAIAMGLGSSHKHARAYHRALADDQGYLGFYKLAVDAGHRLEKAMAKIRLSWSEDVDFYLATEYLSDKLNDFMINNKSIPNDLEWETLIMNSIQEARNDRSAS